MQFILERVFLHFMSSHKVLRGFKIFDTHTHTHIHKRMVAEYAVLKIKIISVIYIPSHNKSKLPPQLTRLKHSRI